VSLEDKAIFFGLVDEGKRLSQKLALRTALAKNTNITKKNILSSCLKTIQC